MGNLGLSEIMVVLIFALIVLGPNRLPGAARQLGKALQEFRRVSNDFQAEVRDAFSEPGTYAPPPAPSSTAAPVPTDAAGMPPPGAPSPADLSPPVDLPTRPEQAELPTPASAPDERTS